MSQGNAIGERELIMRISEILGGVENDDCAVIDAGYRYLVIDDGWQGKRDESGVLHPNERFPDMRALGDTVHGKGLKLGIYSSPGHRTCGNQEGSYGHEEQDARMFAEWASIT